MLLEFDKEITKKDILSSLDTIFELTLPLAKSLKEKQLPIDLPLLLRKSGKKYKQTEKERAAQRLEKMAPLLNERISAVFSQEQSEMAVYLYTAIVLKRFADNLRPLALKSAAWKNNTGDILNADQAFINGMKLLANQDAAVLFKETVAQAGFNAYQIELSAGILCHPENRGVAL